MSFISVRVRGVAAARAAFAEVRQRYIDAFCAGQFVVAQKLMTKFVPGFPKESGDLIESRAIPRELPIRLIVGAAYAIFAHSRGKRKRWLQVPFSRASPTIAVKVARETQRAFRERLTLATAPAEHPETSKATPTDGKRRRKARKRKPRRPRKQRKART